MGKKKKKVARLTEEQYNAYITSLKNDPSAYGTDGEMYIPPVIRKEEEKKNG